MTGLLDARREMVAGVSHELRNPVATILGYSDSLRRTWQGRDPQEVTRDLETIQYEAARLQTILNDLLAASQAETGRLSLSLQAVDVSALAQRVVDTFAGLAWGKPARAGDPVCGARRFGDGGPATFGAGPGEPGAKCHAAYLAGRAGGRGSTPG